MARVRECFLSIARSESARRVSLDGSLPIADVAGILLFDALPLFE